jgi:anti-sigma regulatory factor (Ser/Thr protein kinase)
LLRRWLPADAGITYITDTGPYAAPAKALGAWRALAQERLAGGAPRVRIAGNVPHPGYGIPYVGWDRYEAALDRALGDLPVWAPCLYDARITPAEVLQRAATLHRHLRNQDGTRRVNDTYQKPSRLAEFLTAERDPLEEAAPTLELVDPAPDEARHLLQQLLAGRLATQRADALVLATTEAVTNAVTHGAPPVSVRAWVADGRVVVRVHDRGAGPVDPLVGLTPARGYTAESGRGLWIAHQLDLDVALFSDDDGFAVRFRDHLD